MEEQISVKEKQALLLSLSNLEMFGNTTLADGKLYADKKDMECGERSIYCLQVASFSDYKNFASYKKSFLTPMSIFLYTYKERAAGFYLLDKDEIRMLSSGHCSLDPLPIVEVTKSFSFSYAHWLTQPDFTEEQNKKVFGKCHHVHGHNATLEVTVRGYADIHTGMLINFVDLKRIVNNVIDTLFDHKTLNDDITYPENFKREKEYEFHYVPRTCENTLPLIWNLLYKDLPILSKLRLSETDSSWCTLTKEDMI